MDKDSRFGRWTVKRVWSSGPDTCWTLASELLHQDSSIPWRSQCPGILSLHIRRRWVSRPRPGRQEKLRANTLQQLMNDLSCPRSFQHKLDISPAVWQLSTPSKGKCCLLFGHFCQWKLLTQEPPSLAVCFWMIHRWLFSYQTFFPPLCLCDSWKFNCWLNADLQIRGRAGKEKGKACALLAPARKEKARPARFYFKKNWKTARSFFSSAVSWMWRWLLEAGTVEGFRT